MQAELASLDAGRARYALGCTRAVLTEPAAGRAVAGHAAALGLLAVAVVLIAGYPSAGVRIETLVLVAGVCAAAYKARREGLLGPVAGTRAARNARAMGCVVVAGGLGFLLVSGHHDDPSGWWLAELAVAVGCAARSGPEAALAGLAAAVATCLVIFVAAVSTYGAFGSLVPDRSGPGQMGGLTAQARAETNRIESTDPYVGVFLLGALLGALLISAVTPPLSRPRAG